MPLVLGPLLVGLLPFLAAVVLLGLSQASTSQHGSKTSGSFWDFITGKDYLHSIGGFAAQFSRWIVSRFAAGQLVMLARYFTAMGTLTIHFSRSVSSFATTLTAAVARIEQRGDPKARARAQAANARAIHAGHAASEANSRAKTVGRDLTRYKGRTNARVNHLTHATTVVLPREIGETRAREKELARDQVKLRSRTKALEHGAIKTFDWIRTHPFSASMTAFAGAIALALPRLGLDFLRCPGRNDVGGLRGCGIWDALARLLPLAGLLAIGFDFPEFVAAAELVAEGIGTSIAAIEGAFDVSIPALPPPTTR